MTKFAVIGAGGWGTAMAILLAQRSHEVTLLGHDDAHVSAFCTSRTNLPFLPGCRVPEEVLITTDAKRALEGAEHVLSVVPSSYLRKTWEKLAELVPEGASITSLTKGIENGTFKRPTEIIAEYAAGHDLAVLSGPSFARDVAIGDNLDAVARHHTSGDRRHLLIDAAANPTQHRERHAHHEGKTDPEFAHGAS